MAEIVTLVLLWIGIGFLFFCAYILGKIAGEKKYFDKYIDEKFHSQELFEIAREKFGEENIKEIKDFHLSHLIKLLEEDGRD